MKKNKDLSIRDILHSIQSLILEEERPTASMENSVSIFYKIAIFMVPVFVFLFFKFGTSLENFIHDKAYKSEQQETVQSAYIEFPEIIVTLGNHRADGTPIYARLSGFYKLYDPADKVSFQEFSPKIKEKIVPYLSGLKSSEIIGEANILSIKKKFLEAGQGISPSPKVENFYISEIMIQ